MLKYFLLWFPMLLIAIVNGALRERLIRKYSNERVAHQLSTVTLLVLFTGYIAIITSQFPPSDATQALLIGLLWLLLTLSFEFGFGRWRGNSWSKLLAAYNVLEGRIWILVPLWLVIAPYVLYRLIW